MTTAIQEYSKTDAALAELASRYKGVVFDVTTTAGMQEARTARAELRGYRVELEKTRVEIKAPALERCRLIDAEAKRITAVLVDLEDPIDSTIKSEEKRKEREAMEKAMANQRRIDAIRARIEAIRQAPASCVGLKVPQVAQVLELQRNAIVDDTYAEFQDEAKEALRSSIAQIEAIHAGAVAQEAEAERIQAERAELARLRAEQAERERASREAMEAEQRASRAKIEAEERAAREARAEEQAKLDAERQRIAAERKAAEDKAREEFEAAEARRREIERRETAVMDARAMLTTFKTRFGHLEEFAGVVCAIDAMTPKKRKAA